MKRTALPLAFSFVLALSSLAPALAQGGPQYAFETFDVQGVNVTHPYGIDEAGVVVGSYRDAAVHYHGFVYESGTLATVDHPSGTDTHLLGTLATGTRVGTYRTGGTGYAFLYDGSAFSSVPAPYGGSYRSMNTSGKLVGSYTDSQARVHGILRDQASQSTTTIDYPGAQHTQLVDIDEQGRILGNYWIFGSGRWRGFLYDGTAFTPIDKPGAYWTYLSGMNDQGFLVGQQVDFSGAVRTAIGFDGTQWFDLVVPGATGWTGAQDVNGSGWICGYWQGNHNGLLGEHGFVARPLGVPASYCIGAANSAGPGARIAWSGSASVAANDLVLACSGAPALANGIFFFGAGPNQQPFHDGFLCVTGSIRRLPLLITAAAGTASFAFDNTAPSASGLVAAGATTFFQFWYRDGAGGASGLNLSDGLAVPFAP